MEILRTRPYNTSVNIHVSEPSTNYDYSIKDVSDGQISYGTVLSDQDSLVVIDLPNFYDGQYIVDIDGDEYAYDVVRPYVDPKTVEQNKTATDIANYSKYESIARAIIDSIVTEGFYYRKKAIMSSGNGSDYMPLWDNAKKILRVYENNILVFDIENPAIYESQYVITKDNTAVVVDYNGPINRVEGSPIRVPLAPSDMDVFGFHYKTFHNSFDYTIVFESGYKTVPPDIVRATEMLIDDMACGKLDYYNRYASRYSTDQFRLSFDKRVFDGTGNAVVDKILSKYAKSIKSLGVL